MYGLLVNKDILDLLCLLLHFFRLFLVVDVGEEIKVGKKDEKYCRISHDDLKMKLSVKKLDVSITTILTVGIIFG